MSNKIYKNDEGTVIEINMQEDISSGLNLKLYVRKPNKSEVEWIPTIYNTNYLRYTIQTDDLDEAGIYIINPYIEIDGWKGRGESVQIVVYAHYE